MQQQQMLAQNREKPPSDVNLDRQRVTLLLEINTQLLDHVLSVLPIKIPDEQRNEISVKECVICWSLYGGG